MATSAPSSLLSNVAAAAPDPILGLTEAFRNDPREEKVNLTIGVYRDNEGRTPVLRCVKEAESRLVADEETKGYLGIDGLPEFTQLVRELTLGDVVDAQRVAAFQTPGGTGALRVAAEFVAQNLPGSRLWMSNPTWPNHPAVFQTAGLETQTYAYLSEDRRTLDFDACLASLESTRRGDVICLHACCHNPTGVDPAPDQWEELARVTAEKGLLPLVDFAYHGFGNGLQEDRVGVEALARHHQELLVCSSYSKNFGLYSERVGALFAICPNSAATANVSSAIKRAVRANYSNPPRHGGAIVATILADQDLRQLWRTELEGMCDRIHEVRRLLVDAIKATGCEQDFSFLLKQRGMFSFSGLNPMQVDWLRNEKGIYIVGSGRINVAGIRSSNVEAIAAAIAESLKA